MGLAKEDREGDEVREGEVEVERLPTPFTPVCEEFSEGVAQEGVGGEEPVPVGTEGFEVGVPVVVGVAVREKVEVEVVERVPMPPPTPPPPPEVVDTEGEGVEEGEVAEEVEGRGESLDSPVGVEVLVREGVGVPLGVAVLAGEWVGVEGGEGESPPLPLAVAPGRDTVGAALVEGVKEGVGVAKLVGVGGDEEEGVVEGVRLPEGAPLGVTPCGP